MKACAALLTFLSFACTSAAQTAGANGARSIYLERVTWPDAERVLTPDAVVLIAVGAASKEHGRISRSRRTSSRRNT